MSALNIGSLHRSTPATLPEDFTWSVRLVNSLVVKHVVNEKCVGYATKIISFCIVNPGGTQYKYFRNHEEFLKKNQSRLRLFGEPLIKFATRKTKNSHFVSSWNVITFPFCMFLTPQKWLNPLMNRGRKCFKIWPFSQFLSYAECLLANTCAYRCCPSYASPFLLHRCSLAVYERHTNKGYVNFWMIILRKTDTPVSFHILRHWASPVCINLKLTDVDMTSSLIPSCCCSMLEDLCVHH